MVKLFFTELEQRVGRLALDILGADVVVRAGLSERWISGYLSSYSATIAGGTSEIQRNIIGERVLGLPRDR